MALLFRNKNKNNFSVGFILQVLFLMQRQVKDFVRNPEACFLPPIVAIASGLVCGIVWFDLQLTGTGFQNYFGALINAVMILCFQNIAAVEIFIRGRAIFMHELSNGYYSYFAFFVSKMLSDMLLMQFLPTLLFVNFFYWMAGLPSDFGIYIFSILTGIVLCMCSSAIACLFSIALNDVSMAANLMSKTLILSFLFAGLMVNIASVSKGLSWLQYISIVRYGINCLSIPIIGPANFCGERSFKLENGTTLSGNICVSGRDLLDDQDMPYKGEEKWFNLGMVVVIWAVIIIMSFGKLLTLKKRK